MVFKGLRSKQFQQAWDQLPLTEKFIWLYFMSTTAGLITLLEIAIWG